MCKTFIHYIVIPEALASGFTYTADAESVAVAVMNPGPVALLTAPGASYHPLFLDVPCAGHRSLPLAVTSDVFKGFNKFDTTHPFLLALLSGDPTAPRVTFAAPTAAPGVPVYQAPAPAPSPTPTPTPAPTPAPGGSGSTGNAALVTAVNYYASFYDNPVTTGRRYWTLTTSQGPMYLVITFPMPAGIGTAGDTMESFVVGKTIGQVVAAGYALTTVKPVNSSGQDTPSTPPAITPGTVEDGIDKATIAELFYGQGASVELQKVAIQVYDNNLYFVGVVVGPCAIDANGAPNAAANQAIIDKLTGLNATQIAALGYDVLSYNTYIQNPLSPNEGV